jgi:voltage-gated potassium channel
VRLIVVVTLTIVVLAALLERVIEPETFPTFGEALWWSVVTISTVGYGDVAPQSGAGRLVAGLVMVVSLAFVPVVTSIVVSALLTRHQQRRTESTANRREDAPPSD